MVSWGSFLDFFPFFVEVVRGVVRVEEGVAMGVLGIPPIPDRATGDDFGAISDRAGELCRCACMGVDSVEGTVVPAGEVTTEELDDGAIFDWGDEAARSCWCAAACWCCDTDPYAAARCSMFVMAMC